MGNENGNVRPQDVFWDFISKREGKKEVVVVIALCKMFVFCEETGLQISIKECAELVREAKVGARDILALRLASLAGHHKKVREVAQFLDSYCC